MNKTRDAMENWLHAVNLNPKHVLAWTNLIALLDNTGMWLINTFYIFQFIVHTISKKSRLKM